MEEPPGEVVQYCPSNYRVTVGNLEIETIEAWPNGSGMRLGMGTRVRINGEEIKCRSIDLHIACDDVVTATVEFLPHDQDEQKGDK